jgi:hypothetical protein
MPGTDFALRNQDYARQHVVTRPPAAASEPEEDKQSGFGFGDFLDIINPLQHIPLVSTLYRHLTGDKIATPEKIAGDTLYGGLTGFLSSVGDAIFTEVTGKSVGDTVYAALIGDDEEPPVAVAERDTTSEPTVNPAAMRRAANAYRAGAMLSVDRTPYLAMP